VVLTLPDVYAKRYGPLVEVLVSLATLMSFLFLLAGNFYGMGKVVSYVWGIEEQAAVWISALIVWSYTISGGAYSVACKYTYL
jgi:solute:Na+ symporter, SSS family